MKEIRAAARGADVEDYAAAVSGNAADIALGVDDEALIERVMRRARELPARPGAAPAPIARPPADVDAAIAQRLGFDREKDRGAVHRLLGKVRRWLFRVTKIQAEFEKAYERLNAEMQDLERRLGAEALRGQLRDARPAAADPLALPPDLRAGVTPEEWSARTADYVPFLREGATRAAGAGQTDVLEFGCGDGALAAAAAAAGLSVCGVDPLEDHVAHCAARMVPARQAGLREFLLHAPEHEYRCVLLLHILQHCPLQHVPALLLELKRILAPGGRLIVEIPNADNPLLAGRGPAPGTILKMLATAGFAGAFAHPLHPTPRARRRRPPRPGANRRRPHPHRTGTNRRAPVWSARRTHHCRT